MNRPLPLYVIPDAKLVRYPTSAPLCHAAQLRVSQGRTGGAMTNELEELVFTNAGARPCLLRGYPTISGETPTGSRRELHPQPGGTFFGQLVPADLPPGGHVFLDLSTPGACDQGRKPAIPVRYRHLVFTLSQGGSVGADQVSISEACGYLAMSDFGLPERVSQPRSAHQALVTDVVARESFALNCDSVRNIPARGHVRYAMQLTVPRRATVNSAKIAWSLNNPNGPFAASIVQITR